MNETEFALRCAEGDPSAWDRLVRENIDVLCRAVRRVVAKAAGESEVEDVLQSFFLKLLEGGGRRLRSFQGKCRLSTWLVAVARREALDWLRRKRVRDARAAIPPDDGRLGKLAGDDPGSAAAASQDSRRIRLALESLPARDQLLLRLICLEEAPYEEAARFLAVPLNSISPWLGRAKARLREILVEASGPCTDERTQPL